MSEVTIGGQRLGSGSKMQAEMPHYEMSTQNMNRVRKTTISSGTLVPVFKMLVLPGDRIKVKINASIITPPTVGPLYGSYKFQIDMFTADLRLYNAALHNNQAGLGLKMQDVKFPIMRVECPRNKTVAELDTMVQINPSSILAHLGIMGIGNSTTGAAGLMWRRFNAYPYISYVDIFKNYYANKQEQYAYVIHTPVPTITKNVSTVKIYAVQGDTDPKTIPQKPGETTDAFIVDPSGLVFACTGPAPSANTLMVWINGQAIMANEVFQNYTFGVNTISFTRPRIQYQQKRINSWQYITSDMIPSSKPQLEPFLLSNIDTFRTRVFKMAGNINPLEIKSDAVGLEGAMAPYSTMLQANDVDYLTSIQYPQEGLLVKTYQSDRYNNWLATSTVDAINEQSKIATTGNAFTIASLILGQRLYEMQNAIMTSGGTYDDWQETMYNHKRYASPEIPIYHGGLTKELEFQEVVSNSASETTEGLQPLGQLAGKGRFGQKHKGGEVEVIVTEAGYLIGIASLTPRIVYTQGNDFDVRLRTMNDLHKPALDRIGFQDNITDQMDAKDTEIDAIGERTYFKNGYVPAWLDWMTEVDQAKGNFALKNNQMFMVLARQYEREPNTGHIKDASTYIDPSKYNYTFAETSLDAQNFMLQCAFDVTARRKMSNKVMPKT